MHTDIYLCYLCVLKILIFQVNGSDVLGLCLTDIAKLVHAKCDSVTLLLWNAGCQDACSDESIFCGPLPRNLTRLSTMLQSVLKLIECPICLETIQPPTLQCQNGHLVCVNCRIRSINCPICRDHFTPRRSQMAEQLHATITSIFNLCQKEDRLRQKLFGCKSNKLQQEVRIKEEKEENAINNLTSVINKMKYKNKKIVTHLNTHKNIKKTNSMDNVSSKSRTTRRISECENQIDDIVKIQSDKNHLTNSHLELKAQQKIKTKATANVKPSMETLQVVKQNNNNKISTKKYSVSTNDLSQQIAVGHHSLLTLDARCNESIAYSNVGNGDGVDDAGVNVLITPDVPLITIHGRRKCARVDVETALEAKSASSSTLSLATDNSSQCSCSSSIHYDSTTTKDICQTTTNSIISKCFSTSSSTSSGIFTSLEDYQSSTLAANNTNDVY